ncbi:MAG: DUF2188 domain-containing protein [Armatimonadota bacterium]
MVDPAAQHVIVHMDGGWAVKKHGSTRATRRFDSRKAAISYARKLSRKHSTDLYIHGRDGMVRSKISYGNDRARD